MLAGSPQRSKVRFDPATGDAVTAKFGLDAFRRGDDLCVQGDRTIEPNQQVRRLGGIGSDIAQEMSLPASRCAISNPVFPHRSEWMTPRLEQAIRKVELEATGHRSAIDLSLGQRSLNSREKGE